jgi:DNA polymerase (family X)
MKAKSIYTNLQLAEIFEQIGELLEIKGEIIYKILAYRKAADAFRELDREVEDIWREGNLTQIPGVGKAIAEKVDELFKTGKLDFYEKLTQEVPISLLSLLRVPDVGPKKVALFWKQAGITTLAELEDAARNGKLRSLPGMGGKSEEKIINGLQALARQTGRLPVGKAWLAYQNLAKDLARIDGVYRVEPAGSLRRRRSTVGDLDILVSSKNPNPVRESLVSRRDVIRILGQGETKISLELENGIRIQVWIHPPERFGTALQYATGSKDHNVRLRELALKKGYSLSEHALTRQDGSELLCATEEEVYTALGLPYISPELREDKGEIQAAMTGELPVLIRVEDIQAEFHTHTRWSDGTLTIREMADEAMKRGMTILAITDHSAGIGIAGGLSIDDLMKQQAEIAKLKTEYEGRLTLLHGSEVEIRADGSLGYPDEVLAKLDLVIASLHTSLRQPREQVTARLLHAIQNRHVDIIGHPTGRMIPDREGADLDMEAVLQAAAANGIALEINAHPSRLDLDDIYSKRAISLGIPLVINTDAHSASDLDLLHFGVGIARRSWAQSKHVINAWPTEKILDWLKNRIDSV